MTAFALDEALSVRLSVEQARAVTGKGERRPPPPAGSEIDDWG